MLYYTLRVHERAVAHLQQYYVNMIIQPILLFMESRDWACSVQCEVVTWWFVGLLEATACTKGWCCYFML
jgi:hypothetical protein